MDYGLVGAHEGKEGDGHDIEPLEQVARAVKRLREEKRHEARGNAYGDGEGRGEHVDSPHLHHDVADESPAEAAQQREAHKSDGMNALRTFLTYSGRVSY